MTFATCPLASVPARVMVGVAMTKANDEAEAEVEGDELARLRQEVARDARPAGPRLRLGLALLESGRVDEGASELLLAARIEPATPEVALLACAALERAGRCREAGLLLSSIIYPKRSTTLVGEEQLELLTRLMHHDDPFVRSHVARGIGRLRIAQAVDLLERALTDENVAVQSAAVSSLRQLRAS